MTYFKDRAAAVSRKRPPARVVQVPRDAFSDDWEDKKRMPPVVDVGVKLISDGAVNGCRGDAVRIADRYVVGREEPEGVDRVAWTEAYNDALMRLAVALGTTKAEDVTQPFFEMAEDTVRVALTSEGVRTIWDHIVAHQAATSPLEAPVSREEFAALSRLVAAGALEEAGPEGLGAARMIRFALDDLRRLAPRAAAADESPGIHPSETHAVVRGNRR